VEVTLQPVRRFGFDAESCFPTSWSSACARAVRRFVAGEGPRLDPIMDRQGVGRLTAEIDQRVLAPIYEMAGGPARDHVACDCPWRTAGSQAMRRWAKIGLHLPDRFVDRRQHALIESPR